MNIDKRSLVIGMLINNTTLNLAKVDYAQPDIIFYTVNWSLIHIQKLDPITEDEKKEIDTFILEGAIKVKDFFSPKQNTNGDKTGYLG